MTDTKKTIADWRSEISKELDEAREALAAADNQHTAAVEAAAVSTATHLDLQNTLRDITDRAAGLASLPLANPLVIRLNDHKRAAETAEGHKLRTHVARAAAIRNVAELERAISQIDQLVAPADEEAAA